MSLAPRQPHDDSRDQDHQHRDGHAPAGALKPHHRAPRRNEVMPYIQRLAPSTIAFLQVPLTPARAARLADLVMRTGIPAQTLVLDLLDDCIFDMTPRCITAPAGASTCVDISSPSSISKDRPSAVADKPSHGGSNE